MGIVELRQAWCWTCEDCGRDNFVRPVVYSVASDCCACGHGDEEHAAEGQGRTKRPCEAPNCDCADMLPDPAGQEWVTMPGEVTCEHCGSAFRAVEV